MNVKKLFYIYVDSTFDGRPFYVGKGVTERVNCFKQRNRLHGNISKKHGLKRIIVFETMCEQWALDREIELIALFRTHYGLPGHWGANLTNGGDGLSGHLQSEETRQKRALSLRGNVNGRGNKGTIRSREHCQKLSIAKSKKRKPLSEEHKLNLRKALLGKERSIEHCQNLSKPRRCSKCNELGHKRTTCPKP